MRSAVSNTLCEVISSGNSFRLTPLPSHTDAVELCYHGTLTVSDQKL